MSVPNKHLPECDPIPYERPCICDRLRQCEQRVADEIWGALREGSQYKSGFEGALDAAREAVNALIGWQHGIAMTAITKADATAAIDALREEKK